MNQENLPRQQGLIHEFFQAEEGRKADEETIESRRVEAENSVQQSASQIRERAESRKMTTAQEARHTLAQALHQAESKLSEIKEQAESKRHSETEALKQITQEQIKQGEARFQEAEQAQNAAASQLESAQIDGLTTQIDPPTPVDTERLNTEALSPTEMLGQGKDAARQSASKLIQEVQDLSRWRTHRRRLTFAVIGVTSIIALIAVTSMMLIWQDRRTKIQLYDSAKASLGVGDWEQARSQLNSLLNKDRNYRDAKTLLYESYYLPGAAAVKDERLEEARKELTALEEELEDEYSYLHEYQHPTYHDTTALLRRTYYRLDEDFMDNTNKWLEYDTQKAIKRIQGGKYTFENKTILPFALEATPIALNETEDFKIESEMKKVGGIDNGRYGLFWSIARRDLFYFFLIAGNGEYSYGRMVNGVWFDIIVRTKSNRIAMFNAINKLIIKKSGNQVTFLINDNDNVLNEVEFERFPINRVGFCVEPDVQIEIDNISVYVE